MDLPPALLEINLLSIPSFATPFSPRQRFSNPRRPRRTSRIPFSSSWFLRFLPFTTFKDSAACFLSTYCAVPSAVAYRNSGCTKTATKRTLSPTRDSLPSSPAPRYLSFTVSINLRDYSSISLKEPVQMLLVNFSVLFQHPRWAGCCFSVLCLS